MIANELYLWKELVYNCDIDLRKPLDWKLATLHWMLVTWNQMPNPMRPNFSYWLKVLIICLLFILFIIITTPTALRLNTWFALSLLWNDLRLDWHLFILLWSYDWEISPYQVLLLLTLLVLILNSAEKVE